MKSVDVDVIRAHAHCTDNRSEIQNSDKCGCFHCLRIFAPNKIDDWLEEKGGTAICPFCDIDSVIGSASGFPITLEFLQRMEKHWFNLIDRRKFAAQAAQASNRARHVMQFRSTQRRSAKRKRIS